MRDIAVVGAGPAGVAASVFLKRAGFDISLFERHEVGGLLLNAHFVENYPGFPEGITGKKLCTLLRQHLKKWNIKPIIEEVKQIKIKKKFFIIETKNDKFIFKVVILATGTISKKLDILGEQEMQGKLVFYEIKDLIPKLKSGIKCTIVGSGDAAFDYALNLAESGVKVNLYYRSKKPKCLSLLEDRVNKNESIHTYHSNIPISIIENKGKPEIKFRDSGKNNNYTYDKSDYILIACGRTPNKGLLSKDIEKRNIPGLYIAGDIRTGKFRQTGIAVGEGLKAAMGVETYLRGI